MSREVFTPYKPQAATLRVVDQANIIIEEYQAQGFALSLRQLFYQFVSRASWKYVRSISSALGGIVRDARDGGLIDWDAIEDRTRVVNTHNSWRQPAGHHRIRSRVLSRRPVGGPALPARRSGSRRRR